MVKFSLDDADARFFEGQAGEHVHEWRVNGLGDLEFCECKVCGYRLSQTETACRLNARERLKKLIADLQDANDGPNEMGGPFVAVSVIAAALEGER